MRAPVNPEACKTACLAARNVDIKKGLPSLQGLNLRSSECLPISQKAWERLERLPGAQWRKLALERVRQFEPWKSIEVMYLVTWCHLETESLSEPLRLSTWMSVVNLKGDMTWQNWKPRSNSHSWDLVSVGMGWSNDRWLGAQESCAKKTKHLTTSEISQMHLLHLPAGAWLSPNCWRWSTSSSTPGSTTLETSGSWCLNGLNVMNLNLKNLWESWLMPCKTVASENTSLMAPRFQRISFCRISQV